MLGLGTLVGIDVRNQVEEKGEINRQQSNLDFISASSWLGLAVLQENLILAKQPTKRIPFGFLPLFSF